MVEKVSERMLVLLLLYTTSVFCPHASHEYEDYNILDTEMPGYVMLAIEKCQYPIRVYHGKILVNTQSQTNDKRERRHLILKNQY